MIKVFSDIKDAQEFCDKCHEYLSKNCPAYNALKWSDPVQPDPKKAEFYVQMPQEFEKDIYPVTEKISVTLKTITDKAILTVDKFPEATIVSKE